MKSDDTTSRVRLRFSATLSTRRRSLILAGVAAIGIACCPLFGSTTANAQQQQARPNILVIAQVPEKAEGHASPIAGVGICSGASEGAAGSTQSGSGAVAD
jgi:hypothetical protein